MSARKMRDVSLKYLLLGITLLFSNIHADVDNINPDQLTKLNVSQCFVAYAVGSMETSQTNSYGRLSLSNLQLKNLYGLGVGESLIGEIVIIDGRVHYFTSHNDQDLAIKD